MITTHTFLCLHHDDNKNNNNNSYENIYMYLYTPIPFTENKITHIYTHTLTHTNVHTLLYIIHNIYDVLDSIIDLLVHFDPYFINYLQKNPIVCYCYSLVNKTDETLLKNRRGLISTDLVYYYRYIFSYSII